MFNMIILRSVLVTSIITTLLSTICLIAADVPCPVSKMCLTTEECIQGQLVKKEPLALTQFADRLKQQDQFVELCSTYFEKDKDLAQASQSHFDVEKETFKQFKVVVPDNNNTAHGFHIGSNIASAWALRYFNQLDGSVINQEQRNEAVSILNRWQNTTDNEILVLIKFFDKRLKLQEIQNKNWNILSNMTKYIDSFPKNENHKKEISPLLYSYFLCGRVISILHEKVKEQTFSEERKLLQPHLEGLKRLIDAYNLNKHNIDALYKQLTQPVDRSTKTDGNNGGWIPDHIERMSNRKKAPPKAKKVKKRHRNSNHNQRTPKVDAMSSFVSDEGASDEAHKAETSIPAPIAINEYPAPFVYPLLEGQDQSRTTHEDDILVEIDDPRNKVTITLWKVGKPQKEYGDPIYTNWVDAWFKDPHEALEKQGYNDPANYKYNYRDDAKLIHSFARVADEFLTICGTQSTTTGNDGIRQDTLITMPGYTTDEHGKEQHGLFTYLIDACNGQWYHRNFVPRTREELYSEYMKAGLYEVEFPELR